MHLRSILFLSSLCGVCWLLPIQVFPVTDLGILVIAPLCCNHAVNSEAVIAEDCCGSAELLLMRLVLMVFIYLAWVYAVTDK